MRRHDAKLSDLEAELVLIEVGEETVRALVFACPRCKGRGIDREHYLVVMYDEERRELPSGQLVWERVGGDCIDTLTLHPSYHVRSGCQVHGYIRQGWWRDGAS